MPSQSTRVRWLSASTLTCESLIATEMACESRILLRREGFTIGRKNPISPRCAFWAMIRLQPRSLFNMQRPLDPTKASKFRSGQG